MTPVQKVAVALLFRVVTFWKGRERILWTTSTRFSSKRKMNACTDQESYWLDGLA